VLSKARNNNLSKVRQEAARHVVELEPDNSGMPQEMRARGVNVSGGYSVVH
jgi:hypothetical protein